MNHADLSPAELFAICARGGDSGSWQEFIRRFNPVIARSAIRVAFDYGTADKALVDDLIQETYVKICADRCKLLRTFVPKDPQSPFGFLKVVAASVARDFFRSRLAGKRAPETTVDSINDACPVAASPSARNALGHTERAVLIGQIDRTLKAVVPPAELERARTVFWLYYRSGFTASAIASVPGLELTTKGVESLLFRLTRLVREAVSGPPPSESEGGKGFQQAESF